MLEDADDRDQSCGTDYSNWLAAGLYIVTGYSLPCNLGFDGHISNLLIHLDSVYPIGDSQRSEPGYSVCQTWHLGNCGEHTWW